MAAITTIQPLIDGSLSADPKAYRADMVARMAKILIRKNTYATPLLAWKSLRPHFEFGDIAVLIDDARQVAMQHVVAREMSGS